MPINLPDLPYGKDELEPFISAKTLDFHYGKHHKAYVDNTNKLIAGTDLAGVALEDIVKKAAGLRQAPFRRKLPEQAGGLPHNLYRETHQLGFSEFLPWVRIELISGVGVPP